MPLVAPSRVAAALRAATAGEKLEAARPRSRTEPPLHPCGDDLPLIHSGRRSHGYKKIAFSANILLVGGATPKLTDLPRPPHAGPGARENRDPLRTTLARLLAHSEAATRGYRKARNFPLSPTCRVKRESWG